MKFIFVLIILTSCSTKNLKKPAMDEFTKNEVTPFFKIILDHDEYISNENLSLIKENIEFIEFKIAKHTGSGMMTCHTDNEQKKRKIYISKDAWDSIHGSRIIMKIRYPIPVYMKDYESLIVYRYFIVRNSLIDCLKYGKKVNGTIYKQMIL